MKSYVQDQLMLRPDVKPYTLFSIIASMIHNDQMRGPEPELEQVQNYVKEWRKANPVDSYPQTVLFCAQRMFDTTGISADFPWAGVVLCDTREGEHGLEPNLGDGSETNPFRAGITSYKLLESYVDVQRNPEQTSMLHIDTTFNMNKQRFPVMVIGISDRSGHFFPVGYFCISYRRACDIVWCLRQLDRVLHETFQERLAPEFVMMDGDKAQFNACQLTLPGSVVLMCWYHVISNVLMKAKAKGADRTQTEEIFADMYDLHFAPADEYETRKAEVIAKWDRLPTNSGVQRLARHIIKTWINHRMFGRWQAFHTPAGCPTTNNPLEQYHKTLKINCSNNRATVLEMLESLDLARLAFLARHAVFSNTQLDSSRCTSYSHLTTV
ncbi:hypothetical protein PF005_g24146 [Phytophthora fragariae]|uniref:MULE transposase domain-containing protein n=1 Tax=Phytophthora fragariae TaxID=53985 RepID=A0A6A4BZE8_9STRA|nr:hypothetical protein PF005_g24146 [Phytophthora fragariae]KAE9186879.1 hypothetical protein PF004_g22957 [Phytophthora fragariae]KAE9188114.1 hypothetical protein PF002_g25397 [Phytophthora fragariae]KAE9281861.1 hypothetical protein PF001_g23585 [Phytophthora fragariae]